MKLDKESVSALVKLTIFLVITGMATMLLGLLLSNGSFTKRYEYKAAFTDVTGVAKGDDVRIAGVAVGSVRKIEVFKRDKAIVTFGVDAATPLTENTNVQIRFRNLVGQRYFALSQGADGAKATLKPGSTIPESRTEGALDLNVLFNGFKPVFQALSPKDTNKLAYELIQTVQGEGGNVERLLASTSSLTNTLAGRDKLIGDVITNLSEVLDTVGSRDKELTDTIDTLQQFVTGLKNDREAILGSVDSISGLAVETADLLKQGRPALTEDVKQLDRLTANLSKPKNLKRLSDEIQILPIKFNKLGNNASYGSEFDFFLCGVAGNFVIPAIPGPVPGPGDDIPAQTIPLDIPASTLDRCQP
ncbi:MCE family protein [Aeromicrobium sp.]